MEICPRCGLPKQACVCEQIVKSSQKIKVATDKKRYPGFFMQVYEIIRFTIALLGKTKINLNLFLPDMRPVITKLFFVLYYPDFVMLKEVNNNYKYR